MKSILSFLLFLLIEVVAFAQTTGADPAISGATFTPNVIIEGTSSTLAFQFENTGGTSIPLNSVAVSISSNSAFFSSDGTTPPSGTGASFFTWTYQGLDTWRGVNNISIPASTSSLINLQVTGTEESSGNVFSTISVQIITPSTAFADNPANNSAQASIQILCADPLTAISGDFFVCPGETKVYSPETFDPTSTYVWQLLGGGTLTTNGANATVVWGPNPNSYQLGLTETTPQGCTTTTFRNVTIEDDIVLVCNDNLNISLANNCVVTITPSVILESKDYEDDSYTVVVRDANGNIISNVIGMEYINQILEVSVTHDCSGNSCWGNVKIEDKLPPVIECQNDTITCDQFQNYVPSATLIRDNCQNAVLTYTITTEVLNCDPVYSRILTVVFNAEDASGNKAIPCTSRVYVEKEFISDIDRPRSYDGLPGNNLPLSCSGNFPLNNQGNPHPSFTGFPGGVNNCNSIDWTYTDIKLPLCGSSCTVNNPSYKVIREWVLVDWCTGEIEEFQQIIKVEDNTPPLIAVIPDLTASVNPFDCSAQILLPIASATDNCSAQISYTYTTNVGTIVNGILYVNAPAKTMGPGITITVTATDCCGNFSTRTFKVIIRDTTPPVVVADSHEVISLLPNGSATMYATSLDDGSYDNCGPIKIFAKRMDNGAGKPSIDLFPPTGNDNAQFNEVVHFFCADIPNNPVMVQVRVCDDADMDGTIGSLNDNCNFAMVEVTVQDKYTPIIQCPAPMTISCTDFADIDINNKAQLNTLFGTATAAATCNVTVNQVVSGTATLNCGTGVIVRTFTAVNSAGTESCSQNITVTAFNNNLLTCDRIKFEGLNNNIYNWCAVNDNTNNNNDDLPALNINGCVGINIAQLDIDQAGLCTTVGEQITIDTFSYASSTACKKYIVHYEVIDQCRFKENYVNPVTGQIDPYHSGNGYFEFYLEYNVVDTNKPELVCNNVTVNADDCDGYKGTISIDATDACTPKDQLIYEWKLDVNGDGTVDLPLNGGWFIGNAVTGTILGLPGIPQGSHKILWRVNDGCGNFQNCSQTILINPETKAPTPYCYGEISTAVMPSSGSISIWANDFDAGSFDACGPVELTMIPVIDVEGQTDAQAYNLSFNHPNVTIQSNGDYGFMFDCDYIPNGVSAIIEIRIYVTDENGNYDYCTSSLRIDDNFDVCLNSTGTLTIGGNVKTDKGVSVELVDVALNATLPEFPLTKVTGKNGTFSFSDLYTNMNYDVIPTRNDDHLNGITTLDIVLIQKHILGIEVLANPYTLIAADVNSDCKVSGTDIIQLRKLILGKYVGNQFPNNSSWRFVDGLFTLPTDQQPCDYNEIAEIYNLTGNTNVNFKAVKIGDLNSSAKANLTSAESETRSLEKLKFIIDNKTAKRSETIEIPFYASSFNQVFGFQFSLNAKNMKLKAVISGALELDEDNVGLLNERTGLHAISYSDANGQTIADGEKLFTLKFEANEDVDMLTAISISSVFTKAEAYLGNGYEIYEPVIAVRDTKKGTMLETFELYQNEPNPFNDQTSIAFRLPVSGKTTLTIYDLTGKVVFSKSEYLPKGNNSMVINKTDIPGNGILYYKVDSGDYNGTKKMIIIE